MNLPRFGAYICWQLSPKIQWSLSCNSDTPNHKKQQIAWWLEFSWIPSTWKKGEEVERIDDEMNEKCHGDAIYKFYGDS